MTSKIITIKMRKKMQTLENLPKVLMLVSGTPAAGS